MKRIVLESGNPDFDSAVAIIVDKAVNKFLKRDKRYGDDSVTRIGNSPFKNFTEEEMLGKLEEEINEYYEALATGDMEHALEELVDIVTGCILVDWYFDEKNEE